jgi:signal transduction histidine kinase
LPDVADLEQEVDRLRRHNHLLRQEARALLQRLRQAGAEAEAAGGTPLGEVARAGEHLAEVLRDLQEAPGYHPSHDQVIAIAVRPLVEQVFRWQQRLLGAPGVGLRLELESDHVEWFPARLRHILDGLLANALKYRDPAKAESWVHLGLRVGPDGYEFRVSDNGVGMEARDRDRLFDLLYRAAPVRAAGLSVGLAVIRWLVEQSGGELTAESAPGQGSAFVVTLPRYDVDDFLV